MPFPSVVGTPVQSQALSGNLTLTMPSTIYPGTLLIVIVGADSDTAATMAADWTKKGYNSNGTQGLAVWVKAADGSDTGTVSGASKGRFAHVYQVHDWTGDLADVLVQFTATNNINPPSLNMTTAADHLWIAVARNNADITTAPTNFTDMVETNFFSSAWLASSRRAFNASSLDPGAYGGTLTAGNSLTIGIRPYVRRVKVRHTPIMPRLHSYNR